MTSSLSYRHLIIVMIAAPELVRAIYRIKTPEQDTGTDDLDGVGRMTAAATTPETTLKTRATPQERGLPQLAVVLILLGVLVFWAFGLGN